MQSVAKAMRSVYNRKSQASGTKLLSKLIKIVWDAGFYRDVGLSERMPDGNPTASIPFLLRLFDCKKRRRYLSIDAKRFKEYEKTSCQKCVRLARGFSIGFIEGIRYYLHPVQLPQCPEHDQSESATGCHWSAAGRHFSVSSSTSSGFCRSVECAPEAFTIFPVRPDCPATGKAAVGCPRTVGCRGTP